jgi:hypothetical protein
VDVDHQSSHLMYLTCLSRLVDQPAQWIVSEANRLLRMGGLLIDGKWIGCTALQLPKNRRWPESRGVRLQ